MTARAIKRLTPRFDESINPVAALGFIGLATDRASLRDFCDFTDRFDGVQVHPTRIPFVETATPETLAAMADHLADGARVLVPGQPLQSISYSCTSGTIAIGVDKVHAQIKSVRPQSAVVTPIEAAMGALRALDCRRISLLMPYLMETADMVADFIEAEGFSLDALATFDLGGDPEMNRVSFASLVEAGIGTCAAESDALFISCTGWRTQPIIEKLEEALDKPVVTSNQALAWSALRQAGVTAKAAGLGRLFAEA